MNIHDEITLELSRLERAAHERLRKRCAEQQLGEAWVDLLTATAAHGVSEIAFAKAV